MALALKSAPRNLSSDELTLTLPKTYIRDPLGLGRVRPPPPPDPDIFDLDRENKEFSRSLLSAKELAELDAELGQTGYMTVDQIRALVNANTSKMPDDTTRIDPEMIAAIDQRINYKIYISGENIFTRDDLYNNYAFHEFGAQPETFFIQQELGMFVNADGVEYVARDIGDESVKFICTRDLIQQECRGKTSTPPKPPTSIVKTKIYIGRDDWAGFVSMQRMYRCRARMNMGLIMDAASNEACAAPACSAPTGALSSDASSDSAVAPTDAPSCDASSCDALQAEVNELKRIVREMQIFLDLI